MGVTVGEQTDAAGLAAAALDLVSSDARSAAAAARRALALALATHQPAAASTAQRALGLALRFLGDLPGALVALRAAVRTAERARLSEAAAEARMSLAFVLLDRGRVPAALRQADEALRDVDGLAAARIHAQRALVLQRGGQLDAALQEFGEALPVLQRAGDRLWEARLRTNRGSLLAELGRLDQAETDFRTAGDLHTSLGNALLAADAAWGMGFVAARRGDIRTALERYDVTAHVYAEHGIPVPELLLDRAHVLLVAGLVAEAQDNADQAAEQLTRLLRQTTLAEARLLQAQCALAAGDPHSGMTRAAEAQALFRRQQRPGWTLVARSVALRARSESGQAVDVAAVVRTADLLERAGWEALALDARIIASRAALTVGRHEIARQQLGRAAPARRAEVSLRVRAWYAEALLRDAQGNRTGTEAALRAGMRAVDEHRASLGATELRVHAAAHASDVALFGLERAVRDGDAARVLAWSERWRAGALRFQPVAPPDDGELAALLTTLRTVTSDLESALLEGRSSGDLRRQRVAAEREVLACSRRMGVGERDPVTSVSVAALRQQADDRTLVVLIALRTELVAVVLHRRRLSLHPLGRHDVAAQDLADMHFALRRLAVGQGSGAALAAARTSLETAARRLDARLLGPLRRRLGDGELVIVPTAALHGVPWALLPSVVGRPTVLAPSATVWSRAEGLPTGRPAGPGLLVAGPRLPGAADEVRALSATYRTSTVLEGADASSQRVLAALGTAEWAHVAAHGTLRTDNPLFSSLELADGPLTVYDLERATRVPPLVLLPACQSGVGAARAGEQVLGLAAALLTLGARSVVATVLKVPDQASCALMLALHSRLRAGDAPAVALAAAQSRLPRDSPTALAAIAGFVCLGA